MSKRPPFPIVGIGASAGGLEAFVKLLEHLPLDTGMAFVLVQHLEPTHESMLPEILSRTTAMPVTEVKDGMKVQPNHIYVIPPNTRMLYQHGRLRLHARSERDQQRLGPIDFFFDSLAENRRQRAIGVVLSGTASDGAEGLRAIKAAGGITLAQDEQSAKYSGMPRAAAMAGGVDLILPPERIGRELGRLSRSPSLTLGISKPVRPSRSIEGNAMQKLLTLLHESMRVDFTGYKSATLKRRIARRMALVKIDHLQEYVDYLGRHPNEVEQLYQDLLIKVTRFFRDENVFAALRKSVFPRILENKVSRMPIRIWVPGCSTGEEVYSLAIAFIEYLGEKTTDLPLQLFGTDISHTAIDKARAGLYPESISEFVSAGRLRRFFDKAKGSYQICKVVRDMCIFARQDLIKDPPFSRLDLISCRNLLIYMDSSLQKQIFPIFHYALKPSGFLMLGSSETVGPFSHCFAPVDKKAKLFSRKHVVPSPIFEIKNSAQPIPKIQGAKKPAQEMWTEADLQKEADRLLLAHYSPSGVLINDHMEVLLFRGQTGDYLQAASGRANLNLLKMLREGLLYEVRNAIQKAAKSGHSVRKDPIVLRKGETQRRVRVEVIPIRMPASKMLHFLILFRESAFRKQSPSLPASRGNLEAKRVSNELEATRQHLQAIIEEREATNEELQSANEEITSSNEELQSTNEELETAKEELQSVNEELTVVNEELLVRNVELAQLNNDLSNLFDGLNIPIVMLGPDLHIRRFTPMAQKLLNLIPTDTGRPLSDLKPNINLPDLQTLVADVVDSVTPREIEALSSDGRWFLVRIRPYKTRENKIDGAVLIFLDVDQLKRTSDLLRDARDYAQAIVETVREPLLVLDAQFKIQRANRSFFEVFKYVRNEVENRYLFHLGDGHWDLPGLREHLEGTFGSGKSFHSFQAIQQAPGLPKRTLLFSGRAIKETANNQPLLLLAIQDVTNQERAELELKRKDAELQQARRLEAVGRLAGGVAHDFNNLITGILGISNQLLETMPEGDSRRDDLEEIQKGAQRAFGLTKQLLAFGRRQPAALRVIDPNKLATEMNKMLRRLIGENIQITMELDPDLKPIECDPSHLEQMMANLVLNARDAMPFGGLIRIKTSNIDLSAEEARRFQDLAPGSYFRLSVIDSGTGMDPETLRHIFEPFFTTKEKGNGLGLATVYGLVKQNHGDMTVESKVNQGSTFCIYLPTVDKPVDPEKIPASGDNKGGHETILVIEDEQIVRQSVCNLLKNKGYEILSAQDAATALAIAKRHEKPIHLILTDVVMPGLNGRQAAELVCSVHPESLVLYMSAYAAEGIARNGILDSGINFIEKTNLIRDLATRVRDLLDSAVGLNKD